MLRQLSKISTVTLTILLTAMSAMSMAHAFPQSTSKGSLPPVKDPTQNQFANVQMKLTQKYGLNIGNLSNNERGVKGNHPFPTVIGNNLTPGTVPQRPYIL